MESAADVRGARPLNQHSGRGENNLRATYEVVTLGLHLKKHTIRSTDSLAIGHS